MKLSTVWKRLCLRRSQLVLGPDHYPKMTPKVRMFRLLEEVIELAQCEQVTLDEIHTVARQVYQKPPGLAWQELGGVMITLTAYAGTRDFDLEEAWLQEFERIMDPDIMARVRQRNLSGDKIGMK